MATEAHLRPGLSADIELEVPLAASAAAFGNTNIDVLSTPWLIGFLEQTAAKAIESALGTGQGTVGSRVDVRHLAATPIGMHVRFHAELLEVDGRRLRFRVEGYDQRDKIADGFHDRYVVDTGRFMEAVALKASSPDQG